MADSPVIETKRLRIEPFSIKHLTARYVSWLNDPEVVRYSEQRHRRHSLESCKEYFESFQGTPNYLWAIIQKECGIHMGNINAYVDVNNKVADIGILLGEKDEWNKGYGLEVWKAVITYLFDSGCIRKISAGTLTSNRGMINIMVRSGMVEDGRRVRHYLFDGQEIDALHFALFRKDVGQS
ncbi:MAG TPA: GNAT family N-acetyltransferase [Nitrospirota bacterium]|nr:GNAT family N-acetyltransferase [Nitrospirota bacterium]